MKVTKNDVDKLTAVLKIEIEKEDYESKVEDILKDYRKKARINGFRPGKVPMGLIRKSYRVPVMVEEINKMVSENISNFIKDEKLDIIGDPLPNETEQKKIDFENDERFEFAFDIAIAPEVDVELGKKDKVTKYNIKVDKEQLDEYKKNYGRRFGDFNNIESAGEKDLVKGTIRQLDQEGNIFEDGFTTEDASMSLEMMKDEKEKKKFIGCKSGDIIDFDVKKAYPNDSELKSLLRIDKDVIDVMNPVVQITVNEIKRFEEAELNQELWDKIYGEGKVTSEEEFNAKLEEEIKQNLLQETEYKLASDIKEMMLSKFESDLPKDFLKRWLKSSNKNATDEQIDKEFDQFIEDLKWQIIKNKIASQQEIKVEEAELLEKAKNNMRMQYMYYGIQDIPAEYLDEAAKKALANEDEVRRMAHQVVEDKIMGYLKENVKIEEKEVSKDKFVKMYEK